MRRMTTPDVQLLPTHRVTVVNTENAIVEIRAFLEELAAEGERPWAEVFYPPPAHVDPETWAHEQGAACDAIELVDGELVTLPPYVELIENGSGR